MQEVECHLTRMICRDDLGSLRGHEHDLGASHGIHIRQHREALQYGWKGKAQISDERAVTGTKFGKKIQGESESDKLVESGEIKYSTWAQPCLDVVLVMQVEDEFSQVLQLGQPG